MLGILYVCCTVITFTGHPGGLTHSKERALPSEASRIRVKVWTQCSVCFLVVYPIVPCFVKWLQLCWTRGSWHAQSYLLCPLLWSLSWFHLVLVELLWSLSWRHLWFCGQNHRWRTLSSLWVVAKAMIQVHPNCKEEQKQRKQREINCEPALSVLCQGSMSYIAYTYKAHGRLHKSALLFHIT